MQAVQTESITETSRFLKRLHDPSRPVLVFDGATGTSLQQMDLSADDFGGEVLEGCNENLVVTRPDAVQAVHRQFLEAGCDVIETDTFGAASVVLAEYGLEEQAFVLNKRAAELAREMADEYSTAEKPRFVAGSMGPTTKLPTLGHIDFDTLRTSFRDQAAGLVAGNVDLFIIETCQDLLQVKCAVNACLKALDEVGRSPVDVPIMVSVTIETTGTMLLGTEIAAAVNALRGYPIFSLGLNCATGPREMTSNIEYLARNWSGSVSCVPNAGLPVLVEGRTEFPLQPAPLAETVGEFIDRFGIDIVGGCCGTSPAHIELLADQSRRRQRPRRDHSGWTPGQP